MIKFEKILINTFKEEKKLVVKEHKIMLETIEMRGVFYNMPTILATVDYGMLGKKVHKRTIMDFKILDMHGCLIVDQEHTMAAEYADMLEFLEKNM